MRTLLMSAAFAIGMAAPNVALAQSGHVDVSHASFNEDFGVGELDIDITRVAGQAAFDTDPIAFQVDASYANWEINDDLEAWSLGAHAARRGLRWLVGGYLGYDSLDTIEAWTGAIETQYYMPRGTFSGVLSYSDAEDESLTGIVLEGKYRHFATDNLSVYGGLGVGELELAGVDVEFWQADVGGEWRLETLPISLFAGYRHAEYDVPAVDLTSGTATIGVRYNWGGSLLDRDRSGAGLDRVLPVFERLLV